MAIRTINLKFIEPKGYAADNNNLISPIFYMDENEENIWNSWVWQ